MWKTRKDFEAELIARAWKDDAFKKRLLKDPKAVVEELSGEQFSDDLKISVFEETPTSVCLVIPCDPDSELTDEDLAKVAGGVKRSPGEGSLYAKNLFNRF